MHVAKPQLAKLEEKITYVSNPSRRLLKIFFLRHGITPLKHSCIGFTANSYCDRENKNEQNNNEWAEKAGLNKQVHLFLTPPSAEVKKQHVTSKRANE